MEQQPLVSVVVITYNSSATILETLESIKSQTYQNIELVVSDDCSTDNTAEIVKEWLNKNEKCFVYAKLVTTDVNTGVAGNINRGVFKSHGVWIKSIAGDDLLIPSAIEEYVAFVLKNADVRMCVSDVEPFSVDGCVSRNIMNSYRRFFLLSTESYENQRKRVMTELIFVGPAYFYKRAVFDEVGGFSEKYGCAEEWPFVYKIIMGGNRIYALDKKLVRYRVQASSLCHSDNNDLGNKKVFDGMYHHFFDYAFGDLVRDGRPLTAWHYALSYWARNAQYYIGNIYIRKVVYFVSYALSPLVYFRKLGLVKEIP